MYMYCTKLNNAAKNGEFINVQSILESVDEKFRNDCLNSTIFTGSTPLLMAARYGHVKIVEYLLKNGADPCMPGCVTFDGEKISKAPPLWAAAAAGHLRICEILVENNVNVNQPSGTSSTPLRGACFDGHLSIVKFLTDHGADIEIPNKHGHTALMISCYRGKEELVKYLLSCGALVNRRSLKGNTALHDAAEVGNLPIIRLLIDAGAVMQKDDYGVTPLLTAAIHCHTDIMPYLFRYVTVAEQRDAWKLLGATGIDKRNDLGFGIACWKAAYTSSSSVHKCGDLGDDEFAPMNPIKSRIYGGYREACNLADVLELVGDPEAIRMQALIIRERILGESHSETLYYLRYRGAILCDMGRWERAFEFWAYILQLEQYYMKPLSIATISSFDTFLNAFTALVDFMVLQNDSIPSSDEVVTLEQVIVIIERALYEAERYLQNNCDDDIEDDYFEKDERDIRQETKNLLSIILQLLNLANRVFSLNTRRDRTVRVQTIQLERRLNWNPNDLDLLFLSDFPFSANNIPLFHSSQPLSVSNNSVADSASSSPSTSALSSRSGNSNSNSGGGNINADNVLLPVSPFNDTLPLSSLSSSESRIFCSTSPSCPSTSNVDQERHNEPYVFYSNPFQRKKFCPNTSLFSLTESFKPEVKVQLPLKPKCSHLHCLMRRIVSIFNLFKINALLLACEEHEHFEIKRPPSRFVVEKLIEAGADVHGSDVHGNTALHTVLRNAVPSANIVKLLLDSGSPLLARNVYDETCLDFVNRNSPHLIECLRIGKYLSLKQFAANAVMRNLSGEATFHEILPVYLERYLTEF